MKLKDHVECDCPGGGRIDINKENKTILIYGYSQAYGQCKHEISKEIVQSSFTEYKIETSNEGY